MITPKQRAELKGLANSLPAAFQIGKGGVSDAQTAQNGGIPVVEIDEIEFSRKLRGLCGLTGRV